MKKAKTLLVTLASCVMLSGCSILGFELPSLGTKLSEINVPGWLDPFGIFKDKEPENHEEQETKEVTINLDDMPKTIGLNEEVDLKTVVKLGNATSFSVKITDSSYEVASLNNKVLTPFAEGTIEGTVTAGDKTKDFSINVFSAERTALIETIEKYKDSYSFLIPDQQGYLSGLVTWSDKYYFSDEFEDIYDESGQYAGARAGGYMVDKDGEVYSYYYNYPQTQTGNPNVQFVKTGKEPVSLDGSFQPLDFIDPRTISYDEEKEMFVVTVEEDPTIEAKAEKMLAISFKDYRFSFHSIQFSVILPTETNGLDEPLVQIIFMVLFEGRVQGFNGFVIGEHIDVPYMEAIIDDEVQPAPIVDAKTIFGAGMDEILEAKNFKVSVSAVFCDDEGAAIDNPYGGEKDENLIVHGLGIGQSYTFVTENQILQYNPDEPEITEGAVIHEGKLYNYVLREVEEVPTFVAEPVGDAESVFDKIAGSTLNFKYANSEAGFWSEIFTNEVISNKSTFQIKFNGTTGKALLSAFGYIGIGQSLDRDAITLSHGINTMLNERYAFYKYFDVYGTIITQDQQTTLINFSFDFILEENVHYIVDITIDQVGSTVIPDLGIATKYLD